MTLDPVFPVSWIILGAVLLAMLTLLAHWRSARSLGRGRSSLLTALRLFGVLAIVALLLRISREEMITPPSTERTLLVALDRSGSMAEDDEGGISRLDQAKKVLREAGFFAPETSAYLRFHLFDSAAESATADELRNALAEGEQTLMHSALRGLFRDHQGAPPSALLLLSDGHDHEGIPAGQTARVARDRDCPIYVHPLGNSGSVRDVSIRIAGSHPYTFKKQATRLTASIRTIGCPRETLVVDLLREDEVVKSKRLQTGDASFHDVEFFVSEDEPGQVEYAIRVQPLRGESETSNNTTVTYLNVLDEKVRVLLFEGSPYWDTTFLRRSLARNDKLDVDALIRFAPRKVRALRSNPQRSDQKLVAPSSREQFQAYKVVLVGKDVDVILGQKGITALEEWVDQDGGIVIFCRGRAWDGAVASNLEPISWTETTIETRLEVPASAQTLAPFKLLHRRSATADLPEIRSYESAGAPKALSESYVKTSTESSGVVFRRFGRGQTLSMGIGDLWKWVFNDKTEFDNNLFDLFWDQLVLWMLSNGGVNPSSDYNLQTNTANLATGEEITFTLSLNGLPAPQSPPVLKISHQGQEAAVLTLAPDDDGASYSASFTPRANGRHIAELTLPDGKKARARFISYTEQRERTETATDLAYLEQLASATGGRLVEEDELHSLITDHLLEVAPAEARTRLIPLWDHPSFLFLIIFLIALEWFLRRRWGLT